MRRLLLRLEVIVVLVVAVSLAALGATSRPAERLHLELTAGPGDTLMLSNSREGSAVLSLGGMRPGDSVTDTVNLGNTGTLPGDLTLATSNLVDTPGGGGGLLSGELDLRVRDVTNAGSPVTVYNGKIGAVVPVALGSLAAGASRVYEFRVRFPDAGPGAENAYQGSSMSVQFNWTAFNPEDVDTAPNTTITSAPPALTSSGDATFAFTASEAGSTFECSLDGGAYASCSTPRAYTGLADGAHAFSVRATDTDGDTDATPATHAWTIDATVPSKPTGFSGAKKNGRLVLEWEAAGDNVAVGAYLVYANGSLVKTLGSSARSAKMGPFKLSDTRSFQVAARDTAGNRGAKTRALVIVPRVRDLTVAAATARLTARDLKAGKLTYVYSSSVSSGRVIEGARSGVVAKGTSVGMTVSRGVQPTTPSSNPTPTPPPSYSSGTPPLSPVLTPPTGDPSGSGSPATPPPTSSPTSEADESPNPSTVEPGSFSPEDEHASGWRRLLGLALLGGAFLAAAGVAWRARGAHLQAGAPEDSTVEPLVFWDERFMRRLSGSVRRLLAR